MILLYLDGHFEWRHSVHQDRMTSFKMVVEISRNLAAFRVLSHSNIIDLFIKHYKNINVSWRRSSPPISHCNLEYNAKRWLFIIEIQWLKIP